MIKNVILVDTSHMFINLIPEHDFSPCTFINKRADVIIRSRRRRAQIRNNAYTKYKKPNPISKGRICTASDLSYK